MFLLPSMIVIFPSATADAAYESMGADVRHEKIRFEEIKKEHEIYQSKLQELIVRYNNTPSKRSKKAVATDMRALVDEQVLKSISEAKEHIKAQRLRLEEFEKKVADTENNREAFVDARMEFYTSQKAFEEIERAKEGIVVRRTIIRMQPVAP
jgi:hypothetical protein